MASSFLCGPRGAGIRRLTGNRKLKATYTKRERLIRHTGQSGHGSGNSGPKWLARRRSENHVEKRSSHPQRRGPRRNPSDVFRFTVLSPSPSFFLLIGPLLPFWACRRSKESRIRRYFCTEIREPDERFLPTFVVSISCVRKLLRMKQSKLYFQKTTTSSMMSIASCTIQLSSSFIFNLGTSTH